MDFVTILASIILFTTIATLIVALAAYLAYKMRERRRPKAGGKMALPSSDAIELIFLEPYVPAAADPAEKPR